MTECLDRINGTSWCQYIQQNCTDEFQPGHVNYLHWLYCTVATVEDAQAAMDTRQSTAFALGIAALILYLLFLFIFIGTAAGEYFSPNIATLTKLLGIPSDVAGVTFVAWGNAANDLIGNLISFSANAGALAIGELLGSGLFLCCIVVGTISLMPGQGQPAIPLGSWAVLRDMSVYLLGLALTVSIFVTKSLQRWQGVVFLTLYALYVVLVLVVSNATCRSFFLRIWNRAHDQRARESTMELTESHQELPTILVEDVGSSISSRSRRRSRSRSPRRRSGSNHFLQVPEQSQAMHRYPHSGTNSLSDGARRRSHSGESGSVQLSIHIPIRRGSQSSQSSMRHTRKSSTGTPSNITEMQLPLPRHYREYTPTSEQSLHLRSPSAGSIHRPRGVRSPREEPATENHDISDNIIQLHLTDSLSENMRGPGLLGAVEFWDAWSDHPRSPTQPSPVSQETTASFPEQDITVQDESTFAALLPLVEYADRCPVCFKTCGSTEQSVIKRFVYPAQSSPPADVQWNKLLALTFLSHYCPIFKLWRVQGVIVRFLGLINTLPVLALSLTVPVVFSEQVQVESADQSAPGPDRCPYGSLYMIPWRHRWIAAVQVLLAPIAMTYLLNSTPMPIDSYVILLCSLKYPSGFTRRISS
jgi:Ca2+/Na+ antiporter